MTSDLQPRGGGGMCPQSGPIVPVWEGGGDVVVFLSCFDMRGEQVQCVGHILIFIA